MGILNVIAMIFPFLIRTMMIHYLGSECLGLNSLCVSVLYVLNAAEFGLTDAMVYRLYKPIATNNSDEVCKLLGQYRTVYCAIGSAILFAGLIITPFLGQMISGEKPENVNIYVVFLGYLLNSVFSYTPLAYRKLILLADQHKDYEAMVNSICLVCTYILQMVCIVRGNYYAYVILLSLCSVMFNALIYYMTQKKYPQYVCRKGEHGKAQALWEIGKDMLGVGIYRLRDISRNACDSIIISKMMGLVSVADYQNYYSVLVIPITIRRIFVGAVTPSLGNYIALQERDNNYLVYKELVFLQLFVSGWFAVCYFCLIQDFIVIWIGEEYLLSVAAAFLMSFYSYLLGITDTFKMIRETAGIWNQGKKFVVLEMAGNLLLNVIMGYFWGIEGVVSATIVTIMFLGIPFEGRIVIKKYFKQTGTEYFRIVAKNMAWMAGSGLAIFMLYLVMPDSFAWKFAMKVLACLMIPPLLFLVVMHHTEEFRSVMQRLKRA
ncbi:MAG: hypothetical protein NC409_02950 [Clostridium sp.]|nr:hypothetical protein [Clostridium sp.]